MSDNASWFYGERLPEIARHYNCSLKEAESIFMDDISHEKETKSKAKNIEVEIEEPDLNKLMLMAHENDITLNQLVSQVLKNQLKDNEYQFENGDKPGFLAENK
jgi:predicted HicB family RNase H-like nuclease|tara:strand:+ start:9888 stop:10199 length:312 start_codon:yes stop_codon:yes gene_type:complete